MTKSKAFCRSESKMQVTVCLYMCIKLLKVFSIVIKVLKPNWENAVLLTMLSLMKMEVGSVCSYKYMFLNRFIQANRKNKRQ